MFKNVATKLAIYAFDSTTGAPKTGDAANLTAYVSKDYGAVTVLTDTSATEMSSTNAPGWYLFDLAQAETNADALLFTGKSVTANIYLTGQLVFTTAQYSSDVVIDSSGIQSTNPTGDVVLTSLTVNGEVSITDGLDISASTLNRDAIRSTGNGTGAGFKSVGGTTAPGIEAKGGPTSGDGFYSHADGSGNGINAAGTDGAHGMQLTGNTTGDGLSAQGGASGVGGHFTGGSSSGAGFRAEVQAANGNGFEAVGAGTGVAFLGDITTTFPIKTNTAFPNFMFLMTDSTFHNPASGLTVTVQRSIDGGAFANCTNTPATEVSNGWYKIDLSSSDLNGASVAIKATATGADDTDVSIFLQS